MSVPRSEQTWLELFGSVSLADIDVTAGIGIGRIREPATDADRDELGAFLSVSRTL